MEQEKIKNEKNAALGESILFPPKNEGEVKSSLNLPPQFPSISLNFQKKMILKFSSASFVARSFQEKTT